MGLQLSAEEKSFVEAIDHGNVQLLWDKYDTEGVRDGRLESFEVCKFIVDFAQLMLRAAERDHKQHRKEHQKALGKATFATQCAIDKFIPNFLIYHKDAVFAKADKDNSGALDFEEFWALFDLLKGGGKHMIEFLGELGCFRAMVYEKVINDADLKLYCSKRGVSASQTQEYIDREIKNLVII